jgi:predicted HAD superfamily phosphohydrolase
MKILQPHDAEAAKRKLKDLEGPVKLINFTQEVECQYCRETRSLLEDLSSLSDKLRLEVYDFQRAKETAAQ